jgi:hypothetical protein
MMSDEQNEEREYDPSNVKCLSLSSGCMVIGYIRHLTELGAFVVERPMNVFQELDEEDGNTYYGLVPYNSLADNENVHYFQAHGVIAVSNIAEKSLQLYYKAVREQVAAEQGMTERELVEQYSESLDDFFNEVESNIDSNGSDVVDLASWKPNKADLKH